MAQWWGWVLGCSLLLLIPLSPCHPVVSSSGCHSGPGHPGPSHHGPVIVVLPLFPPHPLVPPLVVLWCHHLVMVMVIMVLLLLFHCCSLLVPLLVVPWCHCPVIIVHCRCCGPPWFIIEHQ
jgi:hypothetical protein